VKQCMQPRLGFFLLIVQVQLNLCHTIAMLDPACPFSGTAAGLGVQLRNFGSGTDMLCNSTLPCLYLQHALQH
jgi:hypothetical protein